MLGAYGDGETMALGVLPLAKTPLNDCSIDTLEAFKLHMDFFLHWHVNW